MSSLSYQIGYQLGVVVARVRRGMLNSLTEQAAAFEVGPSHYQEDLAQTPAMVRKGVDLNDWYNRNVTVSTDIPRRHRTRSPRKPKPLDSLS